MRTAQTGLETAYGSCSPLEFSYENSLLVFGFTSFCIYRVRNFIFSASFAEWQNLVRAVTPLCLSNIFLLRPPRTRLRFPVKPCGRCARADAPKANCAAIPAEGSDLPRRAGRAPLRTAQTMFETTSGSGSPPEFCRQNSLWWLGGIVQRLRHRFLQYIPAFAYAKSLVDFVAFAILCLSYSQHSIFCKFSLRKT